MSLSLKSRMGRIVADHLTPALKPPGLRKSGNVYRAARDGLWWLVDVQGSRWDGPDEVRFTLNAGVYVPGVLATYTGRPEPKQPGPGDCCISARIGMLTPERKDLWWTLRNEDAGADEAIGREVGEAASTYLVPFLERFAGVEDVLRFLETAEPAFRQVQPQNPAIRMAYAAIIHHMGGRPQESRDRLEAAVDSAAGSPIEEHLLTLRARIP